MSTPEQMVESLREEVVALRSRLKAVDLENNDLRNLCTANGINYEETLATKRHRRYFAKLLSANPIKESAKASDALHLPDIGKRLA